MGAIVALPGLYLIWYARMMYYTPLLEDQV